MLGDAAHNLTCRATVVGHRKTWTFKEGANLVCEWDVVTKSSGPGFHKVDHIEVGAY